MGPPARDVAGRSTCAKSERAKLFATWHALLSNGFNVLAHGLGSKRHLLDTFAEERLTDGAVLSVHGFIPDLQVGEVLTPLASLVTKRPQGKRRTRPPVIQVHVAEPGGRWSRGEKKRLMERVKGASAKPPIYVIIHSLDSPSLRTAEWRAVLRMLACCPCIRLVASVDHVLSPALLSLESWGRCFRFWPQHVATRDPFSPEERAVFPQIHSSQSWACASSHSAEVVLRSLTANARDVFKELCLCQIEQDRAQQSAKEAKTDVPARARPAPQDSPDKDAASTANAGLTAQELYRQCRAKFLVTNETTLHAHVREFMDHGLVRTKRTADGAEALVVSLPSTSLQLLVEKMKTWVD